MIHKSQNKCKHHINPLYLIQILYKEASHTQARNQPHSNQYVITQMINHTLLHMRPRETLMIKEGKVR